MNKLPISFYLICVCYCYMSNASVPAFRVSTKCPNVCDCYSDTATNLKSIRCHGAKIVALDFDLPHSTEWLDLGANAITDLDSTSFKELYVLKILHLYANSIHTIYYDAFYKLKHLESIDLSENRLEFLDNRMFQHNPHLKIVNLSGNRFTNINENPFLISASIEVLNLRDCQISYFYSTTFKELKKLRALDLTHNLLITLSMREVKHLGELDVIELGFNQWKCDSNLYNVLDWFEKRNVVVSLRDCANKKSPSQFERMMLAPVLPGENSSEDRESVEIEDWLKDPPKPRSKYPGAPSFMNAYCNRTIVLENNCELLNECREFYLIARNELQREIKWRRSKTVLWVIFGLGAILGLICGVTSICIFNICNNRCMIKDFRQDRQRIQQNIQHEVRIESPDLSEYVQHAEPPVVRLRHPRPRPPPRPSFFATMFRRQRVYPRRPNLLRRLSRNLGSTLRLNSSQANSRAAQRQHSRRELRNGNEQTNLLNATDNNMETATAHDLLRLYLQAGSEAASGEIVPRSETPPPKYCDL